MKDKKKNLKVNEPSSEQQPYKYTVIILLWEHQMLYY